MEKVVEVPSDVRGEVERLQALVQRLRGEDVEVRRDAAKALNAIKFRDAESLGEAKTEVIQPLDDALQKLDDPEARGSAAWALSRLSDWPERIKRFLSNASGRIGEAVSLDRSLPFIPIEEAKEDWETGGRELAVRFMPHVDGRGMELWNDTRQLFLDLQCRVLKHPQDEDRRCIQYIYLWKMQRRPISIFYSTMFFLMFSALVFVHGRSEFFSDWTWQSILLVLAGLTAAVYGAIRYFWPVACFKNQVWYSIGGVLLLFSVLEQVWTRNQFPHSFWILIALAGVTGVVSIALRSRLLEHVMDYGPIYLYLKRAGSAGTPRSDDWDIEEIRYDKHHYEMATENGKDLKAYRKDDTVFMRIGNLWHSFELDRPHSHWKHASWPVRLRVIVYSGLFFFACIFVPVMCFSVYSDICLIVGVALTAALMLLNWWIRIPLVPSVLKSVRTEDLSKLYLSWEKLVHLWNMSRHEARFKVRMKLQEPFAREGDPDYWKDFHDPPPSELAYVAFQKITELRKAIKELKDKFSDE